MKMRRFIGAAAAMAVAGTLTVGAAAETYNAYIGFQTAPYSFRNAFDEAQYGRDAADGKYFNSVIVWGGNDPETFPQYEDKFDDDMPAMLFLLHTQMYRSTRTAHTRLALLTLTGHSTVLLLSTFCLFQQIFLSTRTQAKMANLSLSSLTARLSLMVQ